MRLATIILAVALSGCFFPAGHCGLHPEGAEWEQPGLFAALGNLDGLNVTHMASEPGWPLPDANVAANITEVSRQTEEARLSVSSNGWVSGTFHGTDAEAHRDAARAFLAGLTNATETELQQWTAELMASQRDSVALVEPVVRGEPQVDVEYRDVGVYWQLPVPVETLARYHTLDAADAMELDRRGSGMSAGPWHFSVSVPQALVAFDDWQLIVTAHDVAESVGPRMGEAPQEVYYSTIANDMVAAGLPMPPEHRFHVHGMIC